MASVKYKKGTRAQFDAITNKDSNTLYWVRDTQELYNGDMLYGTGAEATTEKAGLMSANDKVVLNVLAAGAMTLTPVDASIVIEDVDGGRTVGVRISENEHNSLTLEDDGLFVHEGAEYSVEKLGTAADGFAATYRFKKTVDGTSAYVGDAINIPKDLVLRSGSVKVVTVTGEPYAGAAIGDSYIDLELNDEDASHIYIPARGIIDVSNKVDRLVSNADGSRALIFNESDGGGAKFEHKDGSEAFVGVNNGGLNGLMAQIYADKKVNGNWVGSRINVYHDHIYYTSLADVTAGKARNDASCEIATKGDIDEVLEYVTWQEM